MNIKELVHEIEVKLDELSDPERIKWGEINYSTSLKIQGVTVPKLRPLIKELNVKLKKYEPEQIIKFSKELKSLPILEAQQIVYELLDKQKKVRQLLTYEDIKELGRGIDNWVTVDNYAGLIAGPAWREGKISDEVIEAWAVSDDRWWRRAAVVCTVALNQKARGGIGDAERTLKICSLVVHDREDMVIKALSWALRELAKIEQDPVLKFIAANEDKLAKRVLREVKCKIETGRKYD